jgi:hypothetical protein
MSRGSKGWSLVGRNGFAVAASVLAIAHPAAAHISLEEGGTHKSRYGDGELKAGPCGKAGGTRGTNVYTYSSGQKITVTVVETIPHPGYFRFAFDNDGDDAFIEPASIKPIDPSRKCPNDPTDRCGVSDFYNSPAVLPGMDNLNPHLTAAFGTRYTWEVSLPDVECNNCTLQLIQIMEDDLTHGPYDPTPGVGVADIYHQCIDIVLKRSADAGTGGTNDAGPVRDVRPPPSGDAGSTDTGAGGGSVDAGHSPDATGGGTGSDGSTTRDTGVADSMLPPRNDAGSGTGGTSGGTGGSGTGGSGGGGSNAGGSGGGPGAGSGGGPGAGGRAGSGGATPPDEGEGGCSIPGSRFPGKARTAILWSLAAIALASRRRRRT